MAPRPVSLLLIMVCLCACADGECSTLTCDGTYASGDHATALGYQTTASGNLATAMGYQTTASGNYGATAMGQYTKASGVSSTAMGIGTTASGDYATTAMGFKTTASADYSTAMGSGTTANESQSLSVSGNVYAKNIKIHADRRLAASVGPANTSKMLRQLRDMQVFEYSHTGSYCEHLSISPERCAAQRTIGLIAQQVATVAPHAVGSGTSLRLMAQGATTHEELEHIDGVQAIDVHVLLGKLVGSIQSLSEHNEKQSQQIAKQNEQIAKQNEQIAWLMNYTQSTMPQHR